MEKSLWNQPENIVQFISNKSISEIKNWLFGENFIHEEKRAILDASGLLDDKDKKIALLCFLMTDVGYGREIAHEILLPENQRVLSTVIADCGYSSELKPEEKQLALARVISNKETVSWFLGVLFSKSTLNAIGAALRDPEKEIRRDAIERLTGIEGGGVKETLIAALDDRDQKVREKALLRLKETLSPDELQELTLKLQEEESLFSSYANTAKEFILSLPSNIPGMGTIISFAKLAIQQGPDFILKGFQKIVDVGEVFTGAWAKIRSSKSDQSPEYALCLALAWTDGVMEPHEISALENIASAHPVEASLKELVSTSDRPDFSHFEKYLSKLDNARALFDNLCADMKITAKDEDQRNWLKQIENSLAFDTGAKE